MSPSKISLFAVASVVAFASLGCVIRARPAAVYESEAYYEAPAPAGEVVVVDSRPPVEQVEDPGPPPGGTYVWVKGRWMYTSHGWAWRKGHWARARSGHVWVAGHWVQRHHRWVWVHGHWDAAA
jgi:hypothetical protein